VKLTITDFLVKVAL